MFAQGFGDYSQNADYSATNPYANPGGATEGMVWNLE